MPAPSRRKSLSTSPEVPDKLPKEGNSTLLKLPIETIRLAVRDLGERLRSFGICESDRVALAAALSEVSALSQYAIPFQPDVEPEITDTKCKKESASVQAKAIKTCVAVVKGTKIQPWEEPLIDVFRELDADGSGTLTVAELRSGLQLLKLPQAQAMKIVNAADKDGSGEIDFAEWCASIKRHDADEMRVVGERLLAQRKNSGGGYLSAGVSRDPPFMLHPGKQGRIIWDFIVTILLCYIAILWPFFASYDTLISSSALNFFGTLDRCIDVMFVIDIIVNFRTGYANDVGIVVLDPCKCARRYMLSWFPLDFFSSIPFDLVSTEVSNVQAVKLLKIAKVARVLKILSPGRGTKNMVMDFLDDNFSSALLQMLYRRGGVFFFSLILCHWLACGMRFSGNGFLMEYQDVAGDLSREYLAAWYWAMTTMATVGYGDILPHSDSERLWCIVSMVIGGAFYGYVVGNITSMVASSDLNTSAYYERMDLIQAWMDFHKFPKHVRQPIRRHFKTFLMTKSAIDDGVIVDDLTSELREVVGEHLVADVIRHNILFDGVSVGVIIRLQGIADKAIISRGHFIAKYGEEGTAMYIIDSGTARMEKVVDGENVDITLVVGDSFGEAVLLELEDKYTFSVIAITDVVVHMIPCHEFWDSFKSLPSVIKQLRSNAKALLDCHNRQVTREVTIRMSSRMIAS